MSTSQRCVYVALMYDDGGSQTSTYNTEKLAHSDVHKQILLLKKGGTIGEVVKIKKWRVDKNKKKTVSIIKISEVEAEGDDSQDDSKDEYLKYSVDKEWSVSSALTIAEIKRLASLPSEIVSLILEDLRMMGKSSDDFDDQPSWYFNCRLKHYSQWTVCNYDAPSFSIKGDMNIFGVMLRLDKRNPGWIKRNMWCIFGDEDYYLGEAPNIPDRVLEGCVDTSFKATCMAFAIADLMRASDTEWVTPRCEDGEDGDEGDEDV